MNLAQAKRHVARQFPGLELQFRRDYSRPGGACAVLLSNGTPLGVGRSWLQALRDAALRLQRLAKQESLAASSNGRMPGSDPGDEGSSPSAAADGASSNGRTPAFEAVDAGSTPAVPEMSQRQADPPSPKGCDTASHGTGEALTSPPGGERHGAAKAPSVTGGAVPFDSLNPEHWAALHAAEGIHPDADPIDASTEPP